MLYFAIMPILKKKWSSKSRKKQSILKIIWTSHFAPNRYDGATRLGWQRDVRLSNLILFIKASDNITSPIFALAVECDVKTKLCPLTNICTKISTSCSRI